ncbi:MAG: hypothetical protein B7Y25_07310 [Alphaproteobacteria bacterium 16-39-46]|nr:MAG: hypothetical protein B7Y25_07310 [Alphaproteobacteria bacterium 16-39-46]OZA41725.1 MAG: hypothetical protein B7X84_07550 [Alphaproteobacteria bacterium 17-39-52]HQS84731.1 hypothetical protein [Alphaproteobacteria bacterium]HQS94536.1 hypothetical protein [Alphaproteobacteria bacterium]
MASDLPITKNPAARYVPWTVGLMMYLASLAAFLFIVGFHFFGSWRHDLLTHVTLEIPKHSLLTSTLSQNDLDTLILKIKDVVQKTPGVTHITVISPQMGQKLLAPLLGDQQIILKNLPLPTLIEIEKNPEILDVSILEASLKKIFPPLRVINHQTHFSKIFILGFSLEVFLLTLMSAFFVTALLTLSFATRTSLLIHKNIIDILSLLGASDAIIAKEFQSNARTMAIRGAGTAYILLLLTALLGFFLFQRHETFSFPFFFLNHLSWTLFLGLLVPLLMGFFMIFSARLSIGRLLKKLDHA